MLLVFCTADHGGLADYAHAQSEALAIRGQRVLLLAPPRFPARPALYQRFNLPVFPRKLSRFRWLQRLITAFTILIQQHVLSQTIASTGARHVLFTSYSEYLAPLWAWRLRCWSKRGVHFAAVIHDPVRNYVVGPAWWHRFSVAQGYSFLSTAFVHAPINLDTGLPGLKLSTVVIPHGPFAYPSPQNHAHLLRKQLLIPSRALLLLSFGHIRDNKNLALVLKAMVHCPDAWLLVAGPEATAGQHSSTFYQRLAGQLGVAERCIWSIGFQSSSHVADHFTAADVVLLTYSSTFRSASGVMHLASHYRKPVLASAGDSPLLDSVRDFHLGVVISPDDSEAIVAGITRLSQDPLEPDWAAYESAHSWDRNAELVESALGVPSKDLPVAS